MILLELDQDLILEPEAPVRASIDEAYLAELAESIKTVGLLHPPLVVQRGDKYEVIAGHRRLLATRLAGMPKIPVILSDAEDDSAVLSGRIHENIVRRDISPVEEAAFYAELMEKFQDVDKVCEMVRRTRNVVESRLLLLTGDRRVLEALHAGQINLMVAAELNKEKDERKRHWFLEFCITDGATARTVSSWIRSYHGLDMEGMDLSAKPETTPDGAHAVQRGLPCFLCGSAKKQHTMRWVCIHTSCKEVSEMQGWVIQPEGENGPESSESANTVADS